jgi:serine/threonine protein kinase
VKVLDFGLAKVTEKKISKGGEESEAATAFKTAPGIIMGTVNYMSPEQAQARPTDQRTDIWSTGVMIYEMVSGLQPFKGPTDSHTIVQILEKDPVPLTNFTQVKVPAELERIVAKSLSKSAEDRYQTAKDMLIDLRTLKRQLDVEAEIHRTSHPTTPIAAVVPAKVRNEPGKRRVLVIALIGMAVVTAAILGINAWRSSRARTTASSTPPPAAVAERSLSYWITVQRFRNQKPYLAPFQMPGEIIFEKDYQIRLSVGSPQDGYLYVLNEGPEQPAARPEFVVLFPSSTANSGSAHLSAGQMVQIPEQTWIQFDSEQGTEKLWLVFSQEPVPELERAKTFANRRDRGLIPDSNLNQAVEAILKNQNLPKPAVEKDSTKTTLKVANNILVYPIKLEHLGG